MRLSSCLLLSMALLAACQPNPPLSPSAKLSASSPVQAAPKASLTPGLEATLRSQGATDHLQLSLPGSFQTQAIDTSNIAYMRAWVNGPGIANSIYASGGDADGFISVAGNPDPVGFSAIPRGRFRVVKVQFYDINRQPIQAAYAMSVYSSPASGSINLEINRRNIPLAELVQYLQQNNPAFLEGLDLSALQNILESVMNWNGTSFAVDPLRFVPAAIAGLLIAQQGIPANLAATLTPGSAYIREYASLNLTLSGLQPDHQVRVRVNDPLSTPVEVGNGMVNIPTVVPGNWRVDFELLDDSDGYQQNPLESTAISFSANVAAPHSQAYTLRNRWYVSVDGDAAASGKNWNESVSLQSALARASSDHEIWLKAGTYLPATDNRQASFVINKNLTLMGGFSGNESQADQRNPAAHLTILSGDQGQNDDTADRSANHASRQDNSYHVVRIEEEISFDDFGWPNYQPVNVHLSDLIIEGGNANDAQAPDPVGGFKDYGDAKDALWDCLDGLNLDDFTHISETECALPELQLNNQGGGILLQGFSPGNELALNHVQLRHNSAIYGAGAMLRRSDFRIEIHNSQLYANQASEAGAGLYVFEASIDLQQTRFEDNQAREGGGLMLYGPDHEPPSYLYDNLFLNNQASEQGGGLMTHVARLAFLRNIVAGNQAGLSGGGMHHSFTASDNQLDDNLFVNNTATSSAGGLYLSTSQEGPDTLTLYNNSFVNNQAPAAAGIQWFSENVSLELVNTLLLNNAIVRGSDQSLRLIHSATDQSDLASLITDSTVGFGTAVEDQGGQSLFGINARLQNAGNPIGPDGLWKTDDDGLIPLLSSPLVGAGVYRGSTWYIDIRNRLRLSATPESPDYQGFSEDPTIGAYEHNGKPVSSNPF